MPSLSLRSRLAAAALAILAPAALSSCADQGTPLTAPEAPGLDIVPVASLDSVTLVVGDTVRLTSELANPAGHGFEHKKERFAWASSDPSVGDGGRRGAGDGGGGGGGRWSPWSTRARSIPSA